MDPKLVQKDCFDSFTTCIDIVRTDFDKAVELAATLANAELELVRTENRHEYGRLNDNLNETKQCIKEALQKAKKSAEESLFPAAKAVAKTFNVPMVIVPAEPLPDAPTINSAPLDMPNAQMLKFRRDR